MIIPRRVSPIPKVGGCGIRSALASRRPAFPPGQRLPRLIGIVEHACPRVDRANQHEHRRRGGASVNHSYLGEAKGGLNGVVLFAVLVKTEGMVNLPTLCLDCVLRLMLSSSGVVCNSLDLDACMVDNPPPPLISRRLTLLQPPRPWNKEHSTLTRPILNPIKYCASSYSKN